MCAWNESSPPALLNLPVLSLRHPVLISITQDDFALSLLTPACPGQFPPAPSRTERLREAPPRASRKNQGTRQGYPTQLSSNQDAGFLWITKFCFGHKVTELPQRYSPLLLCKRPFMLLQPPAIISEELNLTYFPEPPAPNSPKTGENTQTRDMRQHRTASPARETRSGFLPAERGPRKAL